MIVIGFVGLPGSGKTTIIAAIEDLGTIIIMGDVVRDEAKRRNEAPTDANLGRIAQELREIHGQDVIAEKCVELIKNSQSEIILIDGLRSMAEVNIFRKFWKFPIIATILDEKTRFERLSKRCRPDDPKTLEDLRERDSREIKFGLKEVIENADYKINTDFFIEELTTIARERLKEIISEY